MAADGSPIRIGVVPGTTRPGNKSHAISDWVLSLAKQLAGPSVSYELVDLQDYNLPLLDEPGVPAKDEPTQQHTRVWQARVEALHGVVFVTAQYNWGIPAVLKNALDFLYKEWTGKPAAIISYGGHGGGKAAGQLTQVLEGLRMRPLDPCPALTLGKDQITGSRPLDPASDFSAQAEEVKEALLRVQTALLSA